MPQRREQRERRRHRGSHQYYDEKRGKHTLGKVLAVIQLLISVIFVGILFNSGMIPMKYLATGAAVLFVLFALTFGLQFARSKVNLIGVILSILISAALAFGTYYFMNMHKAISNLGGAEYKTDNMIVVVKKEDSAQSILDTENYIFGVQTAADRTNNEKMLTKLTTLIGQEPNVKEFTTIQEEAQALLDGRIEAAIYNEAFNSLIADDIEGYEDQIRILYQYGIDTKLEKVDQSVTEPFNVYISGIDVYGPISTNSRSDVNIIATINTDTKQMLLVSTPRDYFVPLSISNGVPDKLTHAGIYGIDVSMDTLGMLYDISLDDYFRVNFAGFIKIIDALGGVDMNVEASFSDRGYSFTQGMMHMNGEEALVYARERYAFSDGDRARGRHQMELINAVMQKILSPEILSKYTEVLASLDGCFETNFSYDRLAELVRQQLTDSGSWNIVSYSVNGSGDTRQPYSMSANAYVMIPDQTTVDKAKELMQQVVDGEVVNLNE